ncbi:response regulator transcription factor [Psychrobacillus sp.]|uniref:response regulator transcription factor n=1 Tax=Psychrobacillus sp. TaxID=1871623 RepID=UPI0028BD83EB|nr:response regulator transcription factor [Psychrobacillus sp.]
MKQPRILVVDDEDELASLMTAVLKKEGLSQIETASTLKEGLEKFLQWEPDLILLDIMLPDGEGYDLCKQVRAISNVPILFMSAKTEEIDKLLGLAIGGDDYITKPFSPKEVAYRVKAQLRRAGYAEKKNVQSVVKVGPFQLNADETEVKKNDSLLSLTAKELGLMRCFLHNPNQIISKETLFQRVWGEDFFGSENTVMVHIRRLREKMEDDPSNPIFLTTIKGLGYKLVLKRDT